MSEESRFIHDIVTPLSVAHAHTRIARGALNGDPGKLDLEDLKRRIDRSFEALEKVIQLISDRRSALNSTAD